MLLVLFLKNYYTYLYKKLLQHQQDRNNLEKKYKKK